MILVAIVVLLFLQDWKSLLLPVIDVGVSLVGTFAVMGLMGFSLNNLTLFGLVLAIGIVVDDAIVVLENIERWLEKGLPVREATIGAMNEITGPIIAITLVLSSVFLPSAFLGGITGQFFRQFALTISASMIISAVNAMTMTPARAASIFAGRKPGHHGDQGKEALPWWSFALFGGLATVWFLSPTLGAWLGLPRGEEGGEAAPGGLMASLLTWGIQLVLFLPGAVAGGALGWFLIRPVNWVLGKFFRGFNWVFDRATDVYGRLVGWALRLSAIVLLVYVGLIGLTGFGFTRIPAGFIPSQDKGRLIVNVQLPDSAAMERTVEVMEKLEKIARETPGVAHTISNPGRSFVLNAVGSNLGSMFIPLKPFHERRGPALGADAIAARLRERFRREIPEARVTVFGAPAVDGLGNAGGFKLMVEATGDVNFDALQGQADKLAAQGNRQPGLVGVFNGFRAGTPQLYVDVDRTKVRTMGVTLTDVFDTLQVYLGGFYVNDFNRFGRTWQVNVQADAPFRVDAEDAKQLKVRNADGDMAPLGAVVDIRDSAGPLTVTRYNMFPVGDDHRRVAARGQHRRRPPDDGKPGGPGAASLHDLRVDRAEPPAEAVRQGRAVPRPAAEPLQRVRAGVGAGVFLARGPVRELVAAAGGDPGRADVLAQRAGGHRPPRHGRQHFRAGRLRGAGRPGVQERHPDRRVRPRPAAGRRVPVRRRGGGRPGAAAADRDDLGVLCPHGAAVLRYRRRRRDAPLAGHCRPLGRRWGDALRHLPDAGLLLRGPVVQRPRSRRSRTGSRERVVGPRQRGGRGLPAMMSR